MATKKKLTKKRSAAQIAFLEKMPMFSAGRARAARIATSKARRAAIDDLLQGGE